PFPQPTVLAGIALPGVNATCGITDTDMGWSTAKSFSTSGAQYDVKTVALHEFGHYGVLDHVSCPSNSFMVASYRGTRRSLAGCDRLGMRVANNSPRCKKATGACRPSFFGLTAAFDHLDDEDQGAVAPMSRNVEELNLIWQGDSTLRASSDSVGSFYDSLLEDWYDGGTAADYEIFTSARYAELDAQIISRIYASASTQLRGDLDLLRQHLQTKIGQRIGDLFDIDVVRWPTIQPPGGDCGTQKVCT
ncbi:MAG TPA: hypothetical protein VHK90_06125, partial [Thermoanaerobaculia bacterium]|nr:hypothetical protein [Thermoanaerobaculia bacterium]